MLAANRSITERHTRKRYTKKPNIQWKRNIQESKIKPIVNSKVLTNSGVVCKPPILLILFDAFCLSTYFNEEDVRTCEHIFLLETRKMFHIGEFTHQEKHLYLEATIASGKY